MYQFTIDYTDPDNNQEYKLELFDGFWKDINPVIITQAYGVVLNKDNHVLLVHNSKNHRWQLPGGGIGIR
jgi:hypothetical protein